MDRAAAQDAIQACLDAQRRAEVLTSVPEESPEAWSSPSPEPAPSATALAEDLAPAADDVPAAQGEAADGVLVARLISQLRPDLALPPDLEECNDVRGEAGVGKSRLLQEVQELAKRRNLPRFRVLAAPFGTDRPLEPFRDLVATIVGVDQDAPATVRKKLARLTQLGLSEADVAVLAGLFALESLNPAVPAREILFEATRRLFRGLVAEGPAIVLSLIHISEPTRPY